MSSPSVIKSIGHGYMNWLKSGFRGGQQISNYLLSEVNDPKKSRNWGIAIDLLAGGGLTYLSGMQALGNVAAMAFAVAGILSAPLTGAVTIAISVVFLALNCLMGGFGLGLLDAGRKKLGVPKPTALINETKDIVSNISSSIGKAGKKLSASFKHAVKNDPKAAEDSKPAAPAVKGDFTI